MEPKTIDEELVPYLEAKLKEYQREDFQLTVVHSVIQGAISTWLQEQQLDPETFSTEARTLLILKAASNLGMTLN